MLPKPDGCRGCPLDGPGSFVPDEIVDSPVFVLGQNPGADEERAGRPFVGRSGQELDNKYLPLAGLERGRVSLGNVLRCRWKGTNDLPTGVVLRDAVRHCTDAHLRIPPATQLVIAHGALAWKLLNGKLGEERSISEWRGFLKPELIKVDNATGKILDENA